VKVSLHAVGNMALCPVIDFPFYLFGAIKTVPAAWFARWAGGIVGLPPGSNSGQLTAS